MALLRTAGCVILALASVGAFANGAWSAGLILVLLALALLWRRRTRSPDHVDTEFDELFGIDMAAHEESLQARSELGTYYDLLEEMREAEQAVDTDRTLAAVDKTIPLLHTFVDDTAKSYGRFDIGRIPAIDLACRYWPCLGRHDALISLRQSLESREELQPWVAQVDAALEDADLVNRLRAHLQANPGALQSGLGKALDVHGRKTASLVKSMERLGMVKRTPQGKSHALEITK
jgi:hypothetical protein